MTEDLEIYKQLEKILGISIGYYDGKEEFTIISDNKKIPLEHVYYQKYPEKEGYYKLTKANCDNDNCDIGKPPTDCMMYSIKKCAVYDYDFILDSNFRIRGDSLIDLLKIVKELRSEIVNLHDKLYYFKDKNEEMS